MVGVFVVSAAVVASVVDVLSLGTGALARRCSASRDVPLYMNDLIFAGEPTAGTIAGEILPAAVQVAWYLRSLISVALLLTWRRYRRLAA